MKYHAANANTNDTPYPTKLFKSIFSIRPSTLAAKTDKTKKVVDTGIFNLVKRTKTSGANA